MKLEKIEFSGFKGKALSQQVLDMHEEFQEAYKVFAERTYDCLDLTNAVGGTGLWELQHHVLVSKAVTKNWPTRTPTDSFPPLPSFCYDLISHSGENTHWEHWSCRHTGALAGPYLACPASSGP